MPMNDGMRIEKEEGKRGGMEMDHYF